ncbi:MAG: methylated-DNA--[protein]-cysteine S-methyltransferase [Anaerolineae bacterium]
MSQLDDYRLVEEAIGYLEANFRRQPSLAEVAAAVNLSEYHFQRLFRRWAGISPKRFLQFLTLEYAKDLLAESRALLEVSYETGLSGPGRLHDLFVTLEAVTPGEYRRQGQGLTIEYGVHPSPFGRCLLAATERGICALYFLNDSDPTPMLAELQQDWPEAQLRENAQSTKNLAEAAFTGDTPLTLYVKGTNFQVQVWRALLRIPFGQVVSYEDVAEMIGHPTASRAVGGAVGANPVCYLIPCHRVIRKTGHFGYYGGGPLRKRAMLAWEAAVRERQSADR